MDFALQKSNPESHKNQPTLIPNFSPQFATGQGNSFSSPYDFVKSNARVASSGSINITATNSATAAGSLTLTFTSGLFPGGSLVVLVDYALSATNETVAAQLSQAINASGLLSYYFFTANVDPANLTEVLITQPSSVGNFTTLAIAGTAVTATIVQMTGGKGPIIPLNNFNVSYNNSLTSFFYGIPKIISPNLVATLVKQGLPIC